MRIAQRQPRSVDRSSTIAEKITIDPRNLTQKEIINIMGLNNRSLDLWQNTGMPVGKVGKRKTYDAKEVYRWKLAYDKEAMKKRYTTIPDLSEGADTGDLPASLQKNIADLEHKQMQTKKMEFDLDVKRGAFVPRDQYEETLRKAAVFMRKNFQALGKLLGLKVTKTKKAGEAAKMIDGAVEDVLKRMIADHVPK